MLYYTASITRIVLLMLLGTLPLIAQEQIESEVASSFPVTLSHYLRGLRQHRVTLMPINGSFHQIQNQERDFRRNISGITLIAQGYTQNQEIIALAISVVRLDHPPQFRHWYQLLMASLAILAPHLSATEHLLLIDRALHQGFIQAGSLTLQRRDLARGTTIEIFLV